MPWCMPDWMAGTEDGEHIRKACEAIGTKVIWAKRGDGLRYRSLQIDVLHPFATGGAREGNAGSLVLLVTHGEFSALLTGDLEKEGETELLPFLSDIDVLKVGHHGSRHSTSEEFLSITRPEIALISAPKKSVYRHPHDETLERLDEAGARILMTKDLGAVTITEREL